MELTFFCEHGHLVRSEEIEFWLSDLRICPFRLNFDEFTFQSVSVFFYIWRLGDEIGWSISCKSRWRVGSDVSKFQLRGEMNRKCSNNMITRLIQTFTFWSLFLSGTHLCRSGTDTGLPPKSNILSLMLSSSKSNYQPPHRSTGNSLFCWIAILLTSVIGTTSFWSCFFVHVKFHGCILINDLLKKFYGCKYVIFLYGDVHDSIWMFRGSSLF